MLALRYGTVVVKLVPGLWLMPGAATGIAVMTLPPEPGVMLSSICVRFCAIRSPSLA